MKFAYGNGSDRSEPYESPYSPRYRIMKIGNLQPVCPIKVLTRIGWKNVRVSGILILCPLNSYLSAIPQFPLFPSISPANCGPSPNFPRLVRFPPISPIWQKTIANREASTYKNVIKRMYHSSAKIRDNVSSMLNYIIKDRHLVQICSMNIWNMVKVTFRKTFKNPFPNYTILFTG